MHAMMLKQLSGALEWTELADRVPGPGQIRVRVAACGVCRTDLHVVDGELPDPKLPIIPGHEIVGRVAACGVGVSGLVIAAGGGGRRGGGVGATCGVVPYCRDGRENLCDRPVFTGFARDGGFGARTVADARYCFALPQ